MKGIVFTEFTDMVDSLFGPELTEEILEAATLPSGGAYTSVGTYDHAELVRLVSELSRRSGVPIPELVRRFGYFLFGRFAENYPYLFLEASNTFDFLKSVDSYIHVEVRKLYSDAQLPSFEHFQPGPDQMVLVYRSGRGLADLAEGLIQACADHFGEEVSIERKDLSGGTGTAAEFHIRRQVKP